MPPVLMIVLTLHALAAAFWLFASLAMSISRALTSALLFRLQMVAAAIVVFAGGGLWSMLHRGLFGPREMMLAVGAVCAVVAAGIQGGLVGGSIRRLKSGAQDEAQAGARMRLGQRISAALLAVSLLTMIGARAG